MDEVSLSCPPQVIAMPKTAPTIATARSTASESRASESDLGENAPVTDDPWLEAKQNASTKSTQPSRSPLRDSPLLPLILMIWLAIVVARAAIELSVEIGAGIVALARWSNRRYQAQQQASQSADTASAPHPEQLAPAG